MFGRELGVEPCDGAEVVLLLLGSVERRFRDSVSEELETSGRENGEKAFLVPEVVRGRGPRDPDPSGDRS